HRLVHLCVAPTQRGKGVAKFLINYLKERTKESNGIGLHCREDFKLEKMWARLGFVAKHEKRGRSKDGKLLTFWWLDNGHADLFSTASKQKLESKLCVVIDTQIFTEIYIDKENDFTESKSLFADWLQTELELCITDEIFNKIILLKDGKERNNQRNFAQQNFTCLRGHQNIDFVVTSLSSLLVDKGLAIDEIEVRHLARTIASDSQFFVTLNNRLLELSSEIYEYFKVSIIRPSDLLIQLDELRRKLDYQPVRLAGTTHLEQIPVQKGQEDLLSNYFQCEELGETKAEFQQQLRRFLAESDKFECSIVREENQPLALVVYGRQKKHELEIPMLRVGSNPLSGTLVRHLIFKSILRSAREQRQFTKITDSYLVEIVMTAIQENSSFRRVTNGWLKINLTLAKTASELSQCLITLGSTLGQEYQVCIQFAENLSTENIITDVQASVDIERFLFPAKIIDADIPTFIIPIQPRWAAHLFDEGLANQTLFGAKPELAFNCEAVYYGAIQNLRRLQAPCRIFWYVSGTQKEGKGKGFCEVQSVRACSYVDEVITGKPKELYQRFQRLGVYKLSDLENVKRDKHGKIMAILFSDIELFSTPIMLTNIRKVCKKDYDFQWTEKISPECFAKLYNLAIQASNRS
ncbi:MAG TPA: GNAT family N-acetyltransferase, partial [Phormidium sp.]